MRRIARAWRGIAGLSGGSARSAQGGQGIVEFALVMPLLMLLLLGMLEFGYAFNHNLTIGLATREGARTGAALASGGVSTCTGWTDPNKIDAQIIGGIQRILKSPGSDVVFKAPSPPYAANTYTISQIRIFKADSSGNQIGSYVNVWVYTPGAGPDLDPGTGQDILDFSQQSVGWPACSRLNGASPDSIGVQIRYTYYLETPLASFLTWMHGNQGPTIQMNDQTVMVLNPTS